MNINSDLTIYNKKYDPENRMDTWHKTYIPECHWKVDNKVVQDNNGLRNQDMFKIRIPGKYGESYVDAEIYKSLEDVSDVWTIQKDDYTIQGKGPDIAKPSDLPDRSCRITSWSDNRTNTTIPHFRIGGE